MTRNKCGRCGLVNRATDERCRRCGAMLGRADEISKEHPIEAPIKKNRSLVRRLVWILSTTSVILFVWYFSLLGSSDDLKSDQRQTISRTIEILDQKGFSSSVFLLRHLVSYRSTDNWWNHYVGHRDAYAATNFPFEIVTLYPEFFQLPVDDNERAAILLHESYHLLGHGEEAALEGVWLDKERLGWTADKYGQSRVWNATRQLTMANVPKLFQCGPDHHSDRIQQP